MTGWTPAYVICPIASHDAKPGTVLGNENRPCANLAPQNKLGLPMSIVPPLAAVSTGVHANYATVLVFVLFGIFFGFLALGIAKLLRPHNPSKNKLTTYECGELPRGSSWVRFNVRFYLIALFFIVFDVEVVFLYPWAVVFKQLFPHPQLGALVFWEMIIFLAILTIGLAYVWVKGDLNWVKTLADRGRDEKVLEEVSGR